ncbi:Receptor-type tyrosine-protein phosphatase T [Blattella germanica]|nr:Receptor-type tyrosine-protein phosphatase T [Blattella germanica]
MVWQEHVQVIVMLANTVENGKAKCEQYWPEFGQDVVHGAAHIVNASNQIFADYTYRLLNVTCKGKMRKIHHLHFTSWPDHGVPLYTQSVSSFLKKLLATPPGTGPIVVHCSAGVGRTGSIILCDICLRMAAAEGSVDILGFQQQIREQRANMVDNLDQYKLVHMVLLDCLATEPSSYTCDKNFASRVTELSTSGVIQRQFLRLGNMRWQDEVLRPTKGEGGDFSPAQKDKFKNRNLGIVPGEAKDQFVVTQFPLQSTVGDFWRLIHEKNISLVVVLNEIDVEDKSVCTFWPLGETENLKPMPHLTVSKKQEINSTYCRNYHLQLMVDEEEDTKRLVNVLHLKDWQSDENLPPSTSVILELWQEAERLCSGKDPIAVCCLDGATASGYFVALAFLIEKIKLEQQCDVCQAVRTVRQNREQFVATCEQFEYLYKAAVTYLDTFQIYANFEYVKYVIIMTA